MVNNEVSRMQTKLRLMFNSEMLLRIGVILWLLASTVMIGLITRQIAMQSMTGVHQSGMYRAALIPLSLVAFIVAVFVLRLRGEYAALLILFASMFTPFSLPTGTESRLVDGLLVSGVFVAVWVLRMIVVEKRLHLKPTLVNLPVLIFILVTLLSWLWSTIARDPWFYAWESFPIVQLAATVVMILLPAVMLMVGNLIEEKRTLVWLTAMVLIGGTIGLISEISPIDLTINTGGLFSMWVVSFAVAMGLFNKEIHIFWRGVLLLMGGCWLYLGIGPGITWVSGWLPSLIVVGVMLLMRSWKFFLIGLLILMLFVGLNFDHYLNVMQSEAQESLYTRIDAWQKNWRVTRHHLLLGTGPAGYAVYYVTLFPMEAMATHSNYIDILSQTGLLGILSFIASIIALGVTSVRVVRRLRGRGDFFESFAMATVAGFIGVLVIMGFGDWLFPFAYTQTIAGFDHAVYSWLFLGALLALDSITASFETEDNYSRSSTLFTSVSK
jgi:O-antigen ligase